MSKLFIDLYFFVGFKFRFFLIKCQQAGCEANSHLCQFFAFCRNPIFCSKTKNI